MALVNRDRELAELDDILDRADSEPGPVIAVLSGEPGIGKSVLGTHWGLAVRDRFNGGDLCVDLAARRHHGGVEVSDVLREFIEELGTAPEAIPASYESRAKLFTSVTASRRMLILLDDAHYATEVTPLLPSGAGSVVLVTTIKPLEELFYRGAKAIELDLLNDEDSHLLLSEIAGAARIEAEPEAAAELVKICEGFPIALSVCAGRLVARRSHTVSSVLAGVADPHKRLNGLTGEGGHSFKAVFDFAYLDLELGDALTYRRCGLHPGPDLAATHSALLTGHTVAKSTQALHDLCDSYLLAPANKDRYRFHTLVRLHAAGCAERDDSPHDCEAALRTLVDWYAAGLQAADRALVSDRLRVVTGEVTPPSLVALPNFATRRDVFEWFAVERGNIIAVLRAAAEHEWDLRVCQMAESLWLFYVLRKHLADWFDSATAGVASAKRLGDKAAEARMLCHLARARTELGATGDFKRAYAELMDAEEAAELSGHELLAASVEEFIGAYHMAESSYDSALERFARAREVFASCGRSRGVAIQDFHAGAALTLKGEPEAAITRLNDGLTTMRELGDEINVARFLLLIGQAQRAAGDRPAAESSLAAAAAAAGPLGIQLLEAEAHDELAELAVETDRPADGDAHLRHALVAYRAVGHPRAEEIAAAIGN